MNLAGLLRSRKGAEYSAFLVIVVFISVIYLFIQLYSKLDVFELQVGDQELALLSAYQEGDELLLFIDQSAKYSVYRAVSDTAANGGFVAGSEPCGSILSDSDENYSFWFEEGNKCYSGVNVYDSFEYYLSKNFDSFVEKAHYAVNGNNFEFAVSNGRVVGVSLKPVFIPVVVSPEKKLFYSDVLSKVFAEFGVFGLGVYSVRPSFSVDVEPRISDYDLLKDLVDALLDCVEDNSLDSCVKSSGSGAGDFTWSYKKVSENPVFVFDVKLNKFSNPFSKDPVHVKFALHLPGVRVQ